MGVFEEGVVLMCIGVLGIIGNIISIPYFGQKINRQKNFYTLLTCLSVTDLIVVVTGLLLYAVSKLSDKYSNGMYFVIAPVLFPIFEIGSTGSIYFTLAVCIERYFVVCRPFWYHEKAIPSWRYTIPILLFSVIYNIPRFFEVRTVRTYQSILSESQLNETSEEGYNITLMHLKNENKIVYSVEPTEMRKNVNYYGVYHIGCAIIFQFIIPLLVLIVSNGLILRQLIKYSYKSIDDPTSNEDSAHRRHSNVMVLRPLIGQSHNHLTVNSNNGHETRTSLSTPTHFSIQFARRRSQIHRAKVTLAICGIFTICHLFKWVLNIYELYVRFGSNNLSEEERYKKINESNWFITVLNISNTLIVLNSSINFYIYLLKECWTRNA